VFRLLGIATMGIHVALPDPISILPYLELFTLVTSKPDAVVSCRIATPHLPRLSVLRNNRFQAAPDGTTPTDENAARILDVLAIADDFPTSLGSIPLSHKDPEFE
jgi:hypothetical protein